MQLEPVFWVSIHLLVLGLVGVLWSLPVPEEFQRISPLFNWGSALLMVTAVYYFIISLPLAIGMLPVLLAIGIFELWLAGLDLPLLACASGAIGIGILGLFAARLAAREVVHDCMLAMLAPAYLMSVLYRRVGIPI